MIIFTGTEKSETQDAKLSLYTNDKGEIYVEITSGYHDFYSYLCLDVETAIQLRKQLTKSIGHARDHSK